MRQANVPRLLGGPLPELLLLGRALGHPRLPDPDFKSARLIDEAVLRAVSATRFTEEFTAVLTAEANTLLAEAARRPEGSTKKLEQEIAKRVRQINRITTNLDGMEGDAAIKSVIRKIAEMLADLDQLREQLVEERRRNQRPPITRVKEKDVLAELLRLRDLLQSDVGKAAPVLKELVGDVMLEARPVEGKRSPEISARFTIDAVPASRPCAAGAGRNPMIYRPVFGSS